jgi:hypothetical protein
MNGEVQLIISTGSLVTYTTGCVSLGLEGGVSNDSTFPPVLTNDILNAFVAQALYGGNGTINAYDSSDVLLGTYQLDAVRATVGGAEGQFYFPYLGETSPINPTTAYITFQISTTQQLYLDLFENESISQNWKFQDLNSFTAQGSFTREFRVPYSATNQLALGALFDVNVDAGASNFFHYKLPAEIRVDTLPIATGYVRVRKIYKQQNRINEVELAFYAETPDLVRNIGEKKLNDLDALSALNETVGYDNVTNPSVERIWTILDRGQRWSENGETNTRTLQDPNTPVFAADLTPAISWEYLFNNIISEAGFELVGGTLQSILSQYWMPWCNSRFLQGSDTNGAFGFRAELSASTPVAFNTIPFGNEIFDNNGDYNPATYTYTAPVSGRYFFNFNFNVVITGASARIFVQAIKNVVNNYPIIDVQFFTGASQWAFNDSQLLEAGDTLTWYCYKQGVGTAAFDIGSSVGLQVANLNYSQSIIYSANAPDMKQIDFVTDVIKMHNCAIVADRAVPNKIYVVPQNSYLGSGNVLDWTSKLDISKDVTIGSTTDLQKAKFQFTYTAGEDFLSKVYRNVERIYGDYEAVGYTINPDTAPSDFAIGDQKISLVTRSTPSGVVNGNGYVMPMFLNDSVQFVAPGPRCLYEAGEYAVQLYDDSTTTVVNTNVPVLNNYSEVFPSIDNFDLNWSPEVPPHPINGNPYNNLFNLYWRTYMNALYSPEARMMEASFALSLKDILTFQFSDKIWIQDSYWRIIEVSDYKVGDVESTKVKLLKFLEDTEDCSAIPSTISTNGEVNFVDANNDPVDPSQDCCTRYGYTWDEVNAVCWAFVPTGDRPNSPTSGSSTNPAPRQNKAQTRNAAIINSVISGDNVVIENGNQNTLAVGERLELTKNVNGSNLLGKNVTTNLPGMHVGGGYRAGNPAATEDGWAQFGQFALHRYPTITTSGQVENLFIEGITGEYIDMPDDTLWSCLLNVTIKDATGASISRLLHFTLEKVGGVASASAITTISTIGAIGANVFTFGIDTATNPDEHRINVTFTGGTYPDAFIINTSLQYQQNKTA